MKYPNFSVLMSVYDKESPEYLQESIESILNQTCLPSEIVIVQDGLLNEHLNFVLEQYKNNPLFHICGYDKNRGLGLALNYGVSKCKYDIIARMDSDDISDRNRFEKQLKVLLQGGYDFVGSNTKEFIETIQNVQSVRLMPESNEDILAYSKKRNPFIHPSIMTYKKAILDSGNYQDCYLCEDYDLWIRMIEKGYKFYNIQEYLVFMRVNKNFYKRRGGLKYCRSIVAFKRKIFKKGYMNRRTYLKTKYATIIVSLMPGFLREIVYKKLLRK